MKNPKNKKVSEKKAIKALFDDFVDTYGFPFCEKCAKGTESLDAHHIIYKSQVGWHAEVNCKENIVFLCRDCHTFCHSYPNDEFVRDLIEERGLVRIFNS